jgi:cyclopropane fatty-acyl-phospholipid synthase-like methyltransferase
MANAISSRLTEIVATLPLRPGMRVLEIGCGPGAAARAVVKLIGKGYVLGIDRSAKAIALAEAGSELEIASGRLGFRHVAIENFELEDGEKPYDLAFAIRVGALDGRQPKAGAIARERIRKALARDGRLFIDGGDPLVEISLDHE